MRDVAVIRFLNFAEAAFVSLCSGLSVAMQRRSSKQAFIGAEQHRHQTALSLLAARTFGTRTERT